MGQNAAPSLSLKFIALVMMATLSACRSARTDSIYESMLASCDCATAPTVTVRGARRARARGRSLCFLCMICFAFQLEQLFLRGFCLHGDGDRRSQRESDHGLRRDRDVLVAGHGCSGSAGAGADQAADQCTFASTGEATNQRATAGATADHGSSALALSFDFLFKGVGCDSVWAKLRRLDYQVACAFEFALSFCGDDCSAHGSAGLDDGYVADFDGLS